MMMCKLRRWSHSLNFPGKVYLVYSSHIWVLTEISEAFRLPVSEAAPHVMSQLESRYWSVRLGALRTLSIFAENGRLSGMFVFLWADN
jgi:hypothetical protein